ncbi:hypothetical protein [Nocardioides sp. CFH 31398]|uniref:hypothetical protein n=1 Tax=Nocardioides sp. CFH 31398 TaxID=2919579 RepID=UPI001F063426|nr:hypothetical protein [Nocardioides sp. CFH 31398]MCH1866507.1 hypothetical protein [Nocardioides sp. CFH 31398]
MTHLPEELARAHRSVLLHDARQERRRRALSRRRRSDRQAAELARRAREAVVRDL